MLAAIIEMKARHLRHGDLTLVPLAQSHAAAVVAWRADPAVRPFFFSPGPATVAEQENWTERQQRNPTDLTYIIQDDRGVEVGMVGLYDINSKAGCGEVGRSLIIPKHRGRRHMENALRCILDAGFDEIGLQRIYCFCLADNARMIAIFRKLGFQETEYTLSAQGQAAVRLDVTAADCQRDHRRRQA